MEYTFHTFHVCWVSDRNHNPVNAGVKEKTLNVLHGILSNQVRRITGP